MPLTTPVAGTAGRVKVDGVIIGGIKLWKLDQTTAEIGIPHFESAVDALLRVWPQFLAGLSGATGSMEGYYDVDLSAPTDDVITTGVFATLDLIFNKSSAFGFAVNVLFTSFGPGTNVENQPATWMANFRITGVVPLSAPL